MQGMYVLAFLSIFAMFLGLLMDLLIPLPTSKCRNQDSVVEDIEKVSTDVRKNHSDEKDDISSNVAEEVTEKTIDNGVIDEVCPDDEFNATSAEEELGEEEIAVEFVSEYAEEDVIDALKELYEGGFVPSLPVLVSRMRVTQIRADHLCKVKLMIPSRKKKSFLCPSLKDCPDFFKDMKCFRVSTIGGFNPTNHSFIKSVPFSVRK